MFVTGDSRFETTNMSRPTWGKVSPWIESLILSYDGQEGSSSIGRLKAHVVGVTEMSQSQAQGSVGPTGLLLLSDGVLKLPAILTASAWENLQEQEERESFTSLVNSTVCILDYQMQFYMAPEEAKCRFFLSCGELITTAVGSVNHDTPFSTSLPSIKLKICETWKTLLGQETQDSQSQYGFDLWELLEQWENDCLQAVLMDIRDRLTEADNHPASQQPSSSTRTSSLTYPDTTTATSWDVDRVKYKGEQCFSIPIKCLLMPEEDALQQQTPPNVGKRIRGCSASETTQSSNDDDVEWHLALSEVVERDQDANENAPSPEEDNMLHEDRIDTFIDGDIRPLSNPWDNYPPPSVILSSSDESSEATPSQSLLSFTATDCKSVILTSTQLPVHSSTESQQTTEQSKGEPSYLPPYQKPLLSTSILAAAGSSASASVSPPEPFTIPSNLLLSSEEHHTNTAKRRKIVENDMEETERKYKKAKTKRSEPTTKALVPLLEEEIEEAQINTSPPSWLFDSQAGFGTEEGSSHKQDQPAGTVVRKSLAVHSDGKPFSYSYQVSEQNQQDFSLFKVAKLFVHWAVKYLVPKKDDPQDTSAVTSNQP